MKALILAGGKGTRLMPLTKDKPKPMVPVCGKPLLEWQILLLKKYGIKEVIMCTNYLHEVIEEYFGNGEKFGMDIKYSRETEAMGTAGAIKLAQPLIGEGDFLVLFGDGVLSINLLQMVKYHKTKGAEATVLVHEAKHPMDSDLVEIDNSNKVTRVFRPKPGDEFRPINMSCLYVLNSKVLDRVPLQFIDFGKEVFPKMAQDGGHIQAYITEEYIRDVGRIERLRQVEEDIKSGLVFGLANDRGEYL